MSVSGLQFPCIYLLFGVTWHFYEHVYLQNWSRAGLYKDSIPDILYSSWVGHS